MNPSISPSETEQNISTRLYNYILQIKWLIWPVYKEEQSKILPMAAIFFFVSFIYNILGALKKTLLLSNPVIKAQAVSYLKIFAIMPAAILFTIATAHLQSKYGQKKALQSMIFLFGSSFAVLTIAIFPIREHVIFHLPGNLELIHLLNNWDITLFYIFAEMWSAIVLNVLCWGIIIETTHLKQSKRIYALFTAAANLATLVAGWWAASLLDSQLAWFFSSPVANVSWHSRLLFQMSVVWSLQLVIIYLLEKADIKPIEEKTSSSKAQPKKKVSIIEAIKITWNHPILRSIALIMISFNMIYHLSDVTHSAYVKATLIHNSDLMNKYFNCISFYLGVCAVIFSWLLSGFFVRRFGLKAALMATPVLWFSLSTLDLMASLSNQPGYLWHGEMIPLNLVSLSILLSVGRAIKFTLLDTSKEMSFLSLDSHQKRSGKAAIDGLSSRFGKSGGAWFIILIGSQSGGKIISMLIPVKTVIFACYAIWFYASYTLINNIPDEDNTTEEKDKIKSPSAKKITPTRIAQPEPA